jgi:hypothetical protein
MPILLDMRTITLALRMCSTTRARRIVSSSHGSRNLHMSYVECCNLNNTGFSFYINVEVGRWSGLGHPLAAGLGPWHCAACRCDNLHTCKYHEEMRYCCFRGSWVPFGCGARMKEKSLPTSALLHGCRLPFAECQFEHIVFYI